MRGASERRVGGLRLRSWPLLVCVGALVNRREGGSVLREHVAQYGEQELTKIQCIGLHLFIKILGGFMKIPFTKS